MQSLSELYAKVCAKVPGAKVPILGRGQIGEWIIFGEDALPYRADPIGVGNAVAEAMILKHWLGMLKPGHSFRKLDDDMWTVYENYYDDMKYVETPVEALAAYLLEAPE